MPAHSGFVQFCLAFVTDGLVSHLYRLFHEHEWKQLMQFLRGYRRPIPRPWGTGAVLAMPRQHSTRFGDVGVQIDSRLRLQGGILCQIGNRGVPMYPVSRRRPMRRQAESSVRLTSFHCRMSVACACMRAMSGMWTCSSAVALQRRPRQVRSCWVLGTSSDALHPAHAGGTSIW